MLVAHKTITGCSDEVIILVISSPFSKHSTIVSHILGFFYGHLLNENMFFFLSTADHQCCCLPSWVHHVFSGIHDLYLMW